MPSAHLKRCCSVQFTLAQPNLKVVLREFFDKFSKRSPEHSGAFKRPFQNQNFDSMAWWTRTLIWSGFLPKRTRLTNWRQVMKKILKKYRMTNRDDFPMTGRHIHLLRIRAFASDGINFTEKETAHFDVCRVCR